MTDSSWRKIRAALEDPRWDFRTVSGIARETGLSPGLVELALKAQDSEVRHGVSRDRQKIYTLKSRPRKIREVIADLQVFASNSL